MHLIYVLGLALTAAAAVDALRQGRTPWLWIILFFPTVGALIYFVGTYAGGRSAARCRASSRRCARSLPGSSKRRRSTSGGSTPRTPGPSTPRCCAGGGTRRRPWPRRGRRSSATGRASTRATRWARSLLEAGRPQEAVPALSQALSRNRYVENGEGLFALALAQDRSGDSQAALATLEDLITRHATPPFLWELARVQEATGDRAAARATLERLVDDANYVPAYLRGSVRPWVRRARRHLRELGTA